MFPRILINQESRLNDENKDGMFLRHNQLGLKIFLKYN